MALCHENQIINEISKNKTLLSLFEVNFPNIKVQQNFFNAVYIEKKKTEIYPVS